MPELIRYSELCNYQYFDLNTINGITRGMRIPKVVNKGQIINAMLFMPDKTIRSIYIDEENFVFTIGENKNDYSN